MTQKTPEKPPAGPESASVGGAHPEPPTIVELARRASARRRGAALRHAVDDRWQDVSWEELGRNAAGVARGLIALGIGRGERVAILSETRPEWTYADLGALCAGATVVPVYHTSSREECAYVLEHSGTRLLFCEDEGQLDRIAGVRDRLPELAHVVVLSGRDARATPLDELCALGEGVSDSTLEERAGAVRPDDVATIIYTSGTTGRPKGCMLTHANLRANLDMLEAVLEAGEGDVLYAFLPLAHVLTRVALLFALETGATVAYWRHEMTRVPADLAEVRPTLLPSVPRVFEKVHARALGEIEELGAPQRAAFRLALAAGRARRTPSRRRDVRGWLGALCHPLADRLILARVRKGFGDRVRLAVTGAAPIAPEILNFFADCGLEVLEAYGLTETAAASTLNRPGHARFGTVGPPLPGCEVRIADDGEILIRGPHVFAGYFRDDAATAEAMSDGWLCSGDLGELEGDGFLRITGRKKDLLITSSGKNVAPAPIENALRESPWISQAVVVGDRRPYLAALLTLDAGEAPKLAARLGIEGDAAALAADPRVRAEIGDWVEQVNARFARVEQVKRFTILPRELDVGEGELTPTLKIKRNVITERYAREIEELYEQPRSAGAADRR